MTAKPVFESKTVFVSRRLKAGCRARKLSRPPVHPFRCQVCPNLEALGSSCVGRFIPVSLTKDFPFSYSRSTVVFGARDRCWGKSRRGRRVGPPPATLLTREKALPELHGRAAGFPDGRSARFARTRFALPHSGCVVGLSTAKPLRNSTQVFPAGGAGSRIPLSHNKARRQNLISQFPPSFYRALYVERPKSTERVRL